MKRALVVTAFCLATPALAQGICPRPAGEPIAQCVALATTLRMLADCGSEIEIHSRQVDEWLKCRLEAIDQEYRDRRQVALDQASALKDRGTSALKFRALQR